jgi:hypothetical protein
MCIIFPLFEEKLFLGIILRAYFPGLGFKDDTSHDRKNHNGLPSED